jgi:alpha-L-fucosidase
MPVLPWVIAAEGPTNLDKAGPFNESNTVRFTAADVRFTTKDNVLYATVLGWPGEEITIKSLVGGPDPSKIFHNGLYPSEIVSITMLGDGAAALGGEGRPHHRNVQAASL